MVRTSAEYSTAKITSRRLVDWRSDNRKGLSLLADDDDDYEEEDEEPNQGII